MRESKKVFLTAEWRKLVMANYIVDPGVLQQHVPPGTELDLWENHCYVSLVGFLFRDVRVMGTSVPFHRNFEEVNLRFYVRHKHGDSWRRGVVFLREFVPLPMVSFLANTLYGEQYQTLRMRHSVSSTPQSIWVRYEWKKANWQSIEVKAINKASLISSGSKEEFITQHFWGYGREGRQGSEYEVAHELWKSYPVSTFNININYSLCYGKAFSFMDQLNPDSVFLVEGSPIEIFRGRRIIHG